MTHDFSQEVLGFPFKDPQWSTKLLIGAALLLAGYFIPILPILVLVGYAVQNIRRIVIDKQSANLPEWNQWDKFILDGLRITGVGIAIALPMFVLMFIGYLAMMAPVFVMALNDASAYSAIFPIQMLGMFSGMGLMGIGMFLSVFLSIFSPVAISHMLVKNKFLAVFDIKGWWPVLRANLSGFFLAYVIVVGVFSIMMFAMQVLYMTVILCCLMPIVMLLCYPYLLLVTFANFGYAYRVGAERLEPSTETALSANDDPGL